jgi:hypothetical protein
MDVMEPGSTMKPFVVAAGLQGGTLTCRADDVFTAETKRELKEVILPKAIEMLKNSFSVLSLATNLVVGSSTSCDTYFTVPSAHKSSGVADADFIQESLPEREDLKQRVLAEVDALALERDVRELNVSHQAHRVAPRVPAVARRIAQTRASPSLIWASSSPSRSACRA